MRPSTGSISIQSSGPTALNLSPGRANSQMLESPIAPPPSRSATLLPTPFEAKRMAVRLATPGRAGSEAASMVSTPPVRPKVAAAASTEPCMGRLSSRFCSGDLQAERLNSVRLAARNFGFTLGLRSQPTLPPESPLWVGSRPSPKGGKRTLDRQRPADISNRTSSGTWVQTVSGVSLRRTPYSSAAAATICRNHIG